MQYPTQTALVADRYQPINPLKEGGTSTVYRAFDTQSSQDVALKVVSAAIEPDDQVRKTAFEREMGALQRLDHENVVQLIDQGADGTDWYFVLPLYPGDLSRFLEQKRPEGPLPWDAFANSLGLPLAHGLAHAHDRGVLHRDIKPGNILLSSSGIPKLADFGIAKLKDQVRPEAMTFLDAGTRPFQPREADDGSRTYARDVHALAVVFLMALSALDPYAEKYSDSPYDFIEDTFDAAEIPSLVESLLRESTSEDPYDRPENAAVFLQRLMQIQKGRRKERLPDREFFVGLTHNARRQVEEALRVGPSDVELAVDKDLTIDARIAPMVDQATGESTAGHYWLYGLELVYHVALNEMGGNASFTAISAKPPAGAFVEQFRSEAFDPNSKFTVGDPPRPAEAKRDIALLDQAIAEHEANLAAQRSKDDETAIFRRWRSVLKALEHIEKRREHPLKYADLKFANNGTVRFLLSSDIEESDVLDQTRKVEYQNGGFFTGVVSGLNGRWLYVVPAPGRSSTGLPQSGELRVDTWPAVNAIRRQSAALDAVEYQQSRLAEGALPQLLRSPGEMTPPDAKTGLQFFNKNLDISKQRAVEMGAAAPEFLVVEGPPGTGKTTFITELLQQELHRNPAAKILVASQTHSALDNVVEKLAEHEPDLLMVRVARSGDARVSDRARDFILDKQVQAWRKEVVKRSRRFLKDWAKAYGLDLQSVESAVWLEAVAASRGLDERVQAEIDVLQERLSERPPNLVEGTSVHERFAALRDDLYRLKDSHRDGTADRRELATRLLRAKAIDRLSDVEELSPRDLRDLSDRLIEHGEAHAEAAKALVHLHADWQIRFGRGDEFLAATLERSNVVAATCLGLQTVPGADQIDFDLCVVDEASKATATEVLVPLVQSKRWVLVGDRKQLPPHFDSDLNDPRIREKYQLDDLSRETLFERLADGLPKDAVQLLAEQHRMHHSIGDLISKCFYGDQLVTEKKQALDGLNYVVDAPVTWQSTAALGKRFDRRVGTSYQNMVEARVVRAVCERFGWLAEQKKYDEPLRIGVLSAYAPQRDLLDRQLRHTLERYGEVLEIDCSSVDAFQGRECDVAVYSVTRSNSRRELGFLKEASRLNVALSRARHALVIVGDHSFVRDAKGDTAAWLDVLNYIESPDTEAQLTILEDS